MVCMSEKPCLHCPFCTQLFWVNRVVLRTGIQYPLRLADEVGNKIAWYQMLSFIIWEHNITRNGGKIRKKKVVVVVRSIHNMSITFKDIGYR